MSGKSVLEAAYDDPRTRQIANDRKAMEEREEERKESIAASGNNPMSTGYIKRFYEYMKNETSTPTIETGTSGIIKDTRKYPRTDSPSKPKGGKSRKHRGSRKNKKSRRR